MGKAKNKTSKQPAKTTTLQCRCEHAYECQCGNRPDRPSRGHKWDSAAQAWTGKGHKQKGGSGQISQVAQASIITRVGGIQIAQWQQLPSQLLDDYTKKNKRPLPKYKNIGKKNNEYLYRVILPDPKRVADKDLFFVPNCHVGNAEQAKEEAAMLTLLNLTPNIPHERKLPEPYKTTWLHAVQKLNASKAQTQVPAAKKYNSASAYGEDYDPADFSMGVGKKKKNNGNNNNTNTNKTNSGTSGARASTTLGMANTFTSRAGQRQKREEKQRERNAKIRKHEALRMANQNHPVFLSAKMRQQIQAVLRGDTNLDDLQENDHVDDPMDEPQGEKEEIQICVEKRLHNEGFTKRQALKAFQEISKKNNSVQINNNEDNWDAVYEECLQWLCIHLDEEQLPEGFDPRGGTLDIVKPTSSSPKESTAINNNVISFASKYGITKEEAHCILESSSKENRTAEEGFWNAVKIVANVTLDGDDCNSIEDNADNKEQNLELAQEEIDVLDAMFASDYKINKHGQLSTITIPFAEHKCELQIVVQDGLYPSKFPIRVLLSPCPDQYGAVIHIEIIKFMAENLNLGDPMVFEIYGCVQNLITSSIDGDLKSASLLPAFGKSPQSSVSSEEKENALRTQNSKNSNVVEKKSNSQQQKKRVYSRRPRARSPFWSVSPKNAPPATAFPKISASMEKARKSLPAYRARSEFLAVLEKSEKGGRVVLVTGDTGCGKTTQIPQFILEEKPDYAKIVVAQPRRLAATGVGGRVANERGENQPGVGSVGYVVRGDSAVCKLTRLLFCTTGVLLRQLQNEGALQSITHIIIDEVHERHLDTDILLGILKVRLQKFPHLQVILMSATLDADRFAAYWGKNTPRMHIEGRTFPVEDYMLEDVLTFTGYIPSKKKKNSNRFHNPNYKKKRTAWNDSEKSDNEDENEIEPVSNEKAKNNSQTNTSNIPPMEELISRVDEANLDYDLLATLVKRLIVNKKPQDDGSILVFLSGAPEINKAMTAIGKVVNGFSVLLLPLHGGLPPREQHRVFDKAGYGMTKVILSTNVAETSITIPDCTIVIDSCRHKESSYDPVNRMPLLVEHFASKASLKQRRGRAGRVRKGVCYKLVSHATYNNLQQHGDPEIRRCALDQTLLSLLYLGLERGSGEFLLKLLDPPSEASVNAAVFSLQKLGAVMASTDGLALTPLGMHLAGIPAPPSVGKLLVMGSILGCRRAALVMAAGMSLGRSPFLRIDNWKKNKNETSIEDIKNEMILEDRKAMFDAVGNSDHALLAAVFLKWENTDAGGGARKRVCESLGLSFNGLRDMAQLVRQLDSSLRAAGYEASQDSDRNMKSWRVIRTCVVAALAPSQLVRVHRPTTKYVATVEGASEKDGEARELKFFIRSDKADRGNPPQERVFIHPSSATFKVGSFNCPWLVYHSLVRTSKAFLRDASECSAYALLLFAGKLEVQAEKGTVCVDDWVYLSAKARIGSLIGGLRQKIDDLLAKKIENPTFDLAGTKEMELIVKLLITDGLC